MEEMKQTEQTEQTPKNKRGIYLLFSIIEILGILVTPITGILGIVACVLTCQANRAHKAENYTEYTKKAKSVTLLLLVGGFMLVYTMVVSIFSSVMSDGLVRKIRQNTELVQMLNDKYTITFRENIDVDEDTTGWDKDDFLRILNRITVNNEVVVTIPCTYGELKETGLYIQDNDMNWMIESYGYIRVALCYKTDENIVGFATLKNYSDETVTTPSAIVTGVVLNSMSSDYEIVSELEYADGITFSSTEEELLNKLGEPMKKSGDEDRKTLEWSYDLSKEKYITMQIKIVSGEIYKINLFYTDKE